MDITFEQLHRSIDRDDAKVSFEEAKDIILQYINGQKDSYESDDAPFASSIFSFSKAWNDYITISIFGKQNFHILLSCRYTKKLWNFTYRSTFDREYTVPSYSDLVHLVRLYFITPTEEYKEIYSKQRYKII